VPRARADSNPTYDKVVALAFTWGG
jgi:hypothetical protein